MDFISRHKKIFVSVTLIICILLGVVSLDKKYKPSFVNNAIGFVVTPVSSFFTGIGNWVSDKITYLTTASEMEKQNIALKKEVDELTSQNSKLKRVDAENKNLADLLDIKRKYDYPTTGANVIANDMGNWYGTFVIDKGSKDGLKKDMVVIASGGLVGRIFEAGYNYSKVRSIIDNTSSVSAKSGRTNDIGYLRGDSYLMLEGYCRMDFISADSEMLAGDEIVTSHISSIFPPGIIIGNVKEILTDYTGTKYAIVEPYVDFKHLETVIVVTELFEVELLDKDPDASEIILPSSSPEGSSSPSASVFPSVSGN